MEVWKLINLNLGDKIRKICEGNKQNLIWMTIWIQKLTKLNYVFSMVQNINQKIIFILFYAVFKPVAAPFSYAMWAKEISNRVKLEPLKHFFFFTLGLIRPPSLTGPLICRCLCGVVLKEAERELYTACKNIVDLMYLWSWSEQTSLGWIICRCQIRYDIRHRRTKTDLKLTSPYLLPSDHSWLLLLSSVTLVWFEK